MTMEKLAAEIDRLRRKIAEYQERLKSLEEEKTQRENTEIVGLVRSSEITPEELAQLFRAFQQTRRSSQNETKEGKAVEGGID